MRRRVQVEGATEQRPHADLRGSVALREFFRQQTETPDGWTQARLAEALGLHRNTVNFWVIGRRRPIDDDVRRALRRICGIEEDWWKTDSEKARAEKLSAA